MTRRMVAVRILALAGLIHGCGGGRPADGGVPDNGFMDPDSGTPCSDTDGDSVCDDVDSCRGYPDDADTDDDGAPDACDVCPDHDDSDDVDADGVPDGCDACAGHDDRVDTDSDAVPDGCERCAGGGDPLDGDGDTVPDYCDACPGHSDLDDPDADGLPTACDPCRAGSDDEDADMDQRADACEGAGRFYRSEWRHHDVFGAATGDFDDNGDEDVVFASTSGGFFLRNIGTSRFVERVGHLPPANTVAVADLDGDGDPDIVQALLTAGAVVVTVLRNQGGAGLGDVVFAQSSYPLSSFQVGHLEIVDIDADGFLDILFAGSGQLEALFGDGSGSFGSSTVIASFGNAIRSVAVGDVDGDDLADIVIMGANFIHVFRHDTARHLTEAVSSRFNVDGKQDLALGDVDQDGDADLVIAGGIFWTPNRDGYEWYANDGSGAFSASGLRAQWSSGVLEVDVRDLNEDGVLDVVTTGGELRISFGSYGASPPGAWTPSVRVGASSPEYSPEGVTTLDFDDDGDLDVFTYSRTHQWLTLVEGTTATLQDSYLMPTLHDIDVADLDGDSIDDVFVVGVTNQVIPYIGLYSSASQSSRFNMVEADLFAGEVRKSVLGDVDADGDVDAIVVGSITNVVLLNQGDGSFVQGDYLGFGTWTDIVLADLDGDGDLDLRRVDSDGADGAMLNQGDGNFVDSGWGTVLTYATAVRVADVNGDTLPDAIFGTSFGVRIAINDGSGQVVLGAPPLEVTRVRDIAVLDAEGDGDVDLVIAADGVEPALWTNVAGVFARGTYVGSVQAQHASVGDINGDARPDVVMGRNTFAMGVAALEVWLNTGDGFSRVDDGSLAVRGVEDVEVGDVDGDGVADIVCGAIDAFVVVNYGIPAGL